MGRNARRKKDRNHQLPESWDSPRHGHVERDNFKGCTVLMWDFTNDDPVMIRNELTQEIHTNTKYVPESIARDLAKQAARDVGLPESSAVFTNSSF